MTRAPSAYRLLLRLLPREFRNRHGREMEALFAEHLEGGSALDGAAAWARACWDVVKMAAVLRIRGRGRRNGNRERRATAMTTMDGLVQDLRFATRSLRRRPGFAVVAVTVLAVGIGAVTTIFSVVNGVLLRPLPYEASERIGILWHDLGDGAQSLPALHPLDLYDYREWSTTFEAFTLASGRERILGGQDDAELVDVGYVEAGFFEFFGTRPLHGRSIAPEDDRPGADPVVVLSHRLWARRFGADPGVVGGTVELDGERHRVIGVLPAGFRLHLPGEAFLLTDAEAWAAVRVDPADLPPRNYTGYTAFGRVQPGVSFADAQEDLDRMEARLRERHPVHAASNLQVRVVPLHEDVVKAARPGLVFLFGAVGLVLLVASMNVANLLVARGRSREGELSIRAALGAGRLRVVRLVLLESLVLAGAGGALGVALAGAGLAAVRAMGRAHLPRLDAVALDGPVLLLTAAVSVLAAVVAGLVPALRAGEVGPARVLAAVGRGGTTRSRARFRDGLILLEVAVSLVLLVGAGLMIRSFGALQEVDPGFSTEGLLTFRLSLPDDAYPDDESQTAFYRDLEERLGALPGVMAVSAISQLPLTGSGPLQPYAYDEETAASWESVTADERWVAPGFFRAVRATMLAGREFTPRDMTSDLPLVVVDDRLAARAFPDGDAVGRRLQIRPNEAPEEERYAEIIGVVSHLRLHDLAIPHLTQIYQPMRGEDRFTVVVRSSGSPETLGPPIRQTVREMGPGIPFEDLRTMEALVSAALAPSRISLVLMVLFGAMALVLASVGLYGVLAFDVRQRTREMGIRIALGQGPGEVRWLVIARGMRLVLVAAAVGLGASVVLGRFASSILYGVEPVDPTTYLVVTGVLAVSSLLACWIPARRATRVDPAEALKAE